MINMYTMQNKTLDKCIRGCCFKTNHEISPCFLKSLTQWCIHFSFAFLACLDILVLRLLAVDDSQNELPFRLRRVHLDSYLLDYNLCPATVVFKCSCDIYRHTASVLHDLWRTAM